jgi:hypothetical protein
MKLEIDNNAYYLQYLDKRNTMSSYISLVDTYVYPMLVRGGVYKCEDFGSLYVKVYDTVKGSLVTREYFKKHFRKYSKLRKFFYSF